MTLSKSKQKRRAQPKPFWERGYRSHGFWLGKTRIGIVRVEPGRSLEMKYQWQAGTHQGQTTTLREAKRLVYLSIPAARPKD